MSEKNELENIEIGETDDALVTLKELNVEHSDITDQERKKVLRKIDLWMMPIVTSPIPEISHLTSVR